ncbi:MAG: lysophospholipid acyltransferase family protein [Bacilli bacterium]|nr:lysophospholipid acyltransferase family protein [Bacilli bacterium]
MATRREAQQNIEKCEARGSYNEHVDPFHPPHYPVTEDFPYIPNKCLKLKYKITNLFMGWPLVISDCIFNQHLKIYGKENIKKCKSAIVTCNHVYIFDSFAVHYALRGHTTYEVGASFNNLKGNLGKIMRAGGMLPLSLNLRVLRKFDQAVTYHMKHNSFMLFFPEEGMWDYYEKPRPFKNGAFHYAAKNMVPILPMFITFRPSGKLDKEGLPIKYSNLNILEPIYPKASLSLEENIEYLRKANFEAVKKLYEDYYHKKYELKNYTGTF